MNKLFIIVKITKHTTKIKVKSNINIKWNGNNKNFKNLVGIKSKVITYKFKANIR